MRLSTIFFHRQEDNKATNSANRLLYNDSLFYLILFLFFFFFFYTYKYIYSWVGFWFSLRRFLFPVYEDGTLKCKSHDITNANTIQASRKFRKRWPCQKLRISEWCADAGTAATATVLLVSFDCSVTSISFIPTTLRAMEWQISQVLIDIKLSTTIY